MEKQDGNTTAIHPETMVTMENPTHLLQLCHILKKKLQLLDF